MEMDSLSDSLIGIRKDLSLLGERQLKTIEAFHSFKDELLKEQKHQLEECFSKRSRWSTSAEHQIDSLSFAKASESKEVNSSAASYPKSFSSLNQRECLFSDLGVDPWVEAGVSEGATTIATTSTSQKRFSPSLILKRALVNGRSSGNIYDAKDLREMLYARRLNCFEFVSHPTFDALCGIIICLHAILIGVETEFLAQQGSTPQLIEHLQLSLNIWYFLELLLRMITFGIDFWIGEDRGWNLFDTILVATSIMDLFVINISISSWKTTRILRVLRLFRIVRTLRIMRSLRYVREFRKMVYSLVASLQTLFWSLLLVMAVVYITALWFTQTAAHIRDNDEEASTVQLQHLSNYYSSCGRTMYSLFAAISGGYSWHVLLDPWLGVDYPSMAALFFVFVSTSVFGLLNIVTSVFVESAMHATKHFQDLLVDANKNDIEMYRYHMRKIFAEMDADGGGSISFKEMRLFLTNKDSELPQYLEALGITSSDVWVLFKLLDKDGSGVIDLNEFCEGCMRLKGEAKSFDINCMIYESRAMIKYQSEFMHFVEETLETISTANAQLLLDMDSRVVARLMSLADTSPYLDWQIPREGRSPHVRSSGFAIHPWTPRAVTTPRGVSPRRR